MIANERSLILRLISFDEDMEQFQRYEHEVLSDLFRPVGDLRLLDLPKKSPVMRPERADDLPHRSVLSLRWRLGLTHGALEKEKAPRVFAELYGLAVRPETCALETRGSTGQAKKKASGRSAPTGRPSRAFLPAVLRR